MRYAATEVPGLAADAIQSIEAARFHHAARRRSGGLAGRGARAAAERHPSVKGRIPLSRRSVARGYAVFAYACGLFLVWNSAMIAGTHAALWAIFIFLPGAVFAALTPFIWSGSHWAM